MSPCLRLKRQLRLFMAFIRAGILHYVGRVFAISQGDDEGKSHLMSDHLFLGAALTAMFATESALALADVRRALQLKRMDVFRLTCVCCGTSFELLLTRELIKFTLCKIDIAFVMQLSAASLCLCLATISDMYYTARYFHDRIETFGAVILGWLFFQGPLAYWLVGSVYS